MKRSTAQDIGLTPLEQPVRAGEGGLLSLRWSGRISVTRRILAVNIFAVIVLAASFFQLDSYRTRLISQVRSESQTQAMMIAQALTAAPRLRDDACALQRFARLTGARVRVINARGAVVADAWPTTNQAYGYDDPSTEPWNIKAARALDRIIDVIVNAPALPDFSDAVPLTAPKQSYTSVMNAPDRTPMVSAFAPLDGGYVVTTRNARAITETVRDERLQLGLIIAAAILLSVLLSLFLARTIVQPLRRLASAAVRVRLGRARDVTVPRLPNRNDEIGLLARALSDMTAALRARIDATEAFAADVAHELKNPLASLGSAVDSLAVVQQTELKAQLIEIIRGDVRRLDRLISDIAGLSRLDAQMTRTPFTRVDVHALLGHCADNMAARAQDADVRIQLSAPIGAPPFIMADLPQIERVLANLVENALSFAPPGSEIRLGSYCAEASCHIWVEDDGPGVAPRDRDIIFERFHSDRPDGDPQRQHSGLGLAIVKTIVEAHNGAVVATDHADGSPGARFVITLPAASV